jgi:hypothetical protein
MTAAFVNSNFTAGGAGVYTPTAGNDVIVQVIGIGGASTLTGFTDSVGGDTVLTDFAYSVDATSGVGIAVFRVHGVTAVSHTFTPTFGTAPTTQFFVVCVEASGISGLDTGAGTISLATGNTATPSTETLTPTANGDFLLAAVAMNHFETPGAWTNGFTTAQSFGSGPMFGSGYLVQATAASINAGLGVSAAAAWAGVLVAYTAVGGGSPNTASIAWVT